jgi:two-component system, NarL family, sensor histidine kinase DesK
MSTAAIDGRAMVDGLPDYPQWAVRQARWFLVGLHLALAVVSPLLTVAGFEGEPGNPALAVPAGLAIGALQLRHSLAAARGVRPYAWPWTLLALAVLVYLPMVWFTWDWAVMQYFVIASAAMLLRGWPATLAIAAPIAGTVVTGAAEGIATGTGFNEMGFLILYWCIGLMTAAVALYGSARLVRLAGELSAARTELAELAIRRERLRVSRDLHDLLGQSLSAVSLKGDLALRLLRNNDPPAARAEIESLTEVARDALRDIHAVARDRRAVSLRTEVDGAATLLAAAGVEARIDVAVAGLPEPVDSLLGWAVREGVTNVLRHSEPRTCTIAVQRSGKAVRLEIVNDGARPAAGPGPAGLVEDGSAVGRGLAGLAERARARSGSVSTERGRDGRFTLVVEIPEEVA